MFSGKKAILAAGVLALVAARAQGQTMPVFTQGQALTAAEMNTFVSDIQGLVANGPSITTATLTSGTFVGGTYSGSFAGTATGGYYSGATFGGGTYTGGTATNITFSGTQTGGTWAVGTYLTPYITGQTAGTSMPTGYVGEILTSTATVTVGTTSVSQNITSVVVSPGNFSCNGQVGFTPGSTTVITGLAVGLSSSSGSMPTNPTGASLAERATFTTGSAASMPTGNWLFNGTATSTVYLVTQDEFATSTMVATGAVTCERIN